MRSSITRTICLAIMLAIGLVAPAQAATTITAPPDSPFPFQQWIEEAKVPTPTTTLTLIEDNAACGGQGAGCTSAISHTIYLSPEWTDKRTFYHELGHNFDYGMEGWVRWRFEQLTKDIRPWRAEGGNSPHEQFAEAYSLCALYGNAISHRDRLRESWGYDYWPSPWLQRKVCRMIRNAMP